MSSRVPFKVQVAFLFFSGFTIITLLLIFNFCNSKPVKDETNSPISWS